MAPPSALATVVQVSWPDTAATAWNDTYANILTDCVLDIDIEEHALFPVVDAGGCTIKVVDDTKDLEPGYIGSRVYPNLDPGKPRRMRVLSQYPVGSGNWYADWMGYTKDWQPTSDLKPYLLTITGQSVIEYLASRTVTPPAITTGAVVYDPNDPDHSALTQLLMTMGLWQPSLLSLEAPRGVPVPIPGKTKSDGTTTAGGSWGGAPITFGQAFAELISIAGARVVVLPQYATSPSQPDYIIEWKVLSPAAAPAFDWIAANDDLSAEPRINYGGELP